MISLTDISTAVCRVLARYDAREAYLFGSFARGEQAPDSDIDLRLACGGVACRASFIPKGHRRRYGGMRIPSRSFFA